MIRNGATAAMVKARDHGVRRAVADRMMWDEVEPSARVGCAAFYAENRFLIDAYDPTQTVLLTKMDITVDVPEITEACWDILDKSRRDMMCASSRMVVKRKGAGQPPVLACTL